MSDKAFLDTNIFVYTFDGEAPGKQEKARQLVTAALAAQNAVVSSQVVQEFLNVASRKFKKPLSTKDCQRYLKQVLAPLCEVFPSIRLYEQSIKLVERWGFSFYDSLIVAAALEAGCEALYSEDMQHGQTIQGLTIINPFLQN